MLADRVRIARRFQKSICIDTDLGDKSALDGFVCPRSSVEILMTMVRHVAESGQGAFTWTGPYGSGKSSLAIALSALLKGKPEFQKQAATIFGRKLTNNMRKALPTGTKGWRVIPVVGRRDDPVTVIGEALQSGGLVQRRPRGGWTESNLIARLSDIAKSHPRMHGGIILFVDEMGKFLEAAALDGTDIYIFQQLAEAASRSKGRLLLVGVLHQAFEEYAHRLSHEMRDEWAKIQGRFIDLPVNTVGEEQIDLISRAIEVEDDNHTGQIGVISATIAKLAHRDHASSSAQLAATLENCWPLHPVVACLLGPISRRRFGQNQRSIFGFLNSSEPHGFQDYLHSATGKDLYGPERLWDYLRTNLEPSILASPDGHRWALAAEALERCEAHGGDAFLVSLLKTIAIIDLFKERSGLLANRVLLKACFPQVTAKAMKQGLAQLDRWSLMIYKRFLDAYTIFAGSDFDIDQAVTAALEEIDEIDFVSLKMLAGLQPMLAKRHYHETGTMRWFDIDLVPVCHLADLAKEYKPNDGVIGQFLLAVPTEGESEEIVREICRESARLSDEWDILVGFSKRSWTIVTLARELLALDKVSNDHPELAGDPVARREVTARLADLQGQLESVLYKAFDRADWYRKHHQAKPYRQADLNSLASDLADRRFNQCPRLHNELLNRHKPSSSAIAGQNILLRYMVQREGEPRLGIKGYPTEGGLLNSILESTGLYFEKDDKWQFVAPSGDDVQACRLTPAWKVAIDHVKKNNNRSVSISEIRDIWRMPPYGIKDGLMPILAVAFILSLREKLAVYREGIFLAHFNDVAVEYMAKDPSSLQLRWMDLSGISRRLLSDMAEIVRDLDHDNELIHLEPIDVARGLVSIYENLPQWTKRTMRLSSNAVQVRDIFKKANDPNKFLFDDLPVMLGERKTGLSSEDDIQHVVSIVHEGLKELCQTYNSMLHRVRDIMLSELQVPNLSPQSLFELRTRAENVRELTGDFRLEAFIGRLCQYDGNDEGFEGIASLIANKPPRDWVDPDVDHAGVEIAEMSQKFLRAETFTRVKGRPEKRQAMAVVIGMEGRPTPLLEEFDVLDTDRTAINDLIERVTSTLESVDTNSRRVILAALAEISANYIQTEDNMIQKNKLRKGSRVS